MKYYTEGFITVVGQVLEQNNPNEGPKMLIKFQPTPPFIFEENGKAFCLIKSNSDTSASLLACDEKKLIALPNLMFDINTALALRMHVRIRIGGETDEISSFNEWETT